MVIYRLISRIFLNYTSSEAESDAELYVQLLNDGILETFETLLPSDRLTKESFENMTIIVSNVCITSIYCRDRVLTSKCYKLLLQRHNHYACNSINNSMSWLLCNIMQQWPGSELNLGICTATLARLKIVCMQTNIPEVVHHMIYALYLFVKDHQERQQRLAFIFADEFYLRLFMDYVGCEQLEIKSLVMQVLAYCAEFTGSQIKSLGSAVIINEMIKVLRSDCPSKMVGCVASAWRYLTLLLANSEQLAAQVVRNDRELFVLVGQHLGPLDDDQHKIEALGFLRASFMTLGLEQLKNIFRLNPDLVNTVIGVLEEYDYGDSIRVELVMTVLDVLQVLLNFGKVCEVEEGSNWVKERIETAPENNVLDKMAAGQLGGNDAQRKMIADKTTEILADFFDRVD
jgi:hypothetical protein